MSEEYIKQLEKLVESLTKVVEKRDSGDYAFLVISKHNYRIPNNEKIIFKTLNEALIEWLSDTGLRHGLIYTGSGALELLENLEKIIDIYEYNIRTKEKVKVFG